MDKIEAEIERILFFYWQKKLPKRSI